MSDHDWHLYLIRCRDNSLYTGITKNINRRLEEHRSGNQKGAKYLRGRAPLTLVWQHQTKSHSDALKLEQRIKKFSKYDKERLISGQLPIQFLEAAEREADDQDDT